MNVISSSSTYGNWSSISLYNNVLVSCQSTPTGTNGSIYYTNLTNSSLSLLPIGNSSTNTGWTNLSFNGNYLFILPGLGNSHNTYIYYTQYNNSSFSQINGNGTTRGVLPSGFIDGNTNAPNISINSNSANLILSYLNSQIYFSQIQPTTTSINDMAPFCQQSSLSIVSCGNTYFVYCQINGNSGSIFYGSIPTTNISGTNVNISSTQLQHPTISFTWTSIYVYGNYMAVCGGTSTAGGIYWADLSSTTPSLTLITGSNTLYNWNSVSIYGSTLVACQSTGGIYYCNLPNPTLTQIPSSGNQQWSSVSNYGSYIVACQRGSGGGIYYSQLQTPSPTPAPAPAPSLSNSPIIITYPNPIVAGEPATIMYESFNPNTYPVNRQKYVLRNNLDLYVSDIFQAGPNENTYTFYNVILTSGINTLSIYNITTGATITTINENAVSLKVEVPSICFKEGTKILSRINNEDRYIPIEQLDDTIYVKTYKHGYKKLKFVLKSKIINSKEKTINKLYVMKKTENNNLIEDLYVTGSHALLKDNLTENQKSKMNKLIEKININYNLKIDDKYKIIACFDKRFQEFNEPGYFNIYHLVLESENEIFKNYGIYANGILAESTDEITLNRMKDYKLINLEYNDTKEKKILENIKEQKLEKEKLEKNKLLKNKIEQEKIEKNKLLKNKLEQEKIEKEKLEQEKLEQEKLEKNKLLKNKIEQEKLEKNKLLKNKLEQEKIEKNKIEQEKLEKEKIEKKKIEQEKLEKKKIVPTNMYQLKKKYKNAIIE